MTDTAANLWLTAICLVACAPILPPLAFLGKGERQDRLRKWRISNTRGARIFRFFYSGLDYEPLCIQKKRHTKKYWVAITLAAILLPASITMPIWVDYAPWMRSPAAERCVAICWILSALMLSTVLPNPRIRYWPNTLTKELIEDIYRPQIDRLREIATHFDRYVAEYEQRAATQAPNTRWTPINIDIELFSIPAVFSASVATGSPDEWALVGGFYCGVPAEAARIVAKRYFSPRKWPMSETALRAGWVKLSDYSRKNAVIYSGALIDDRGERREFELCLNLKAVISQIPKANTSQR